jgi:hypothetical protein
MKVLSTNEGKDWLLLNSWDVVAEDSWQQRYGSKVSYHLPEDTGKKTVLARALASLVTGTQQGALWITDWGAFQSCQNVELFYGYRRSFGENRLLIDAPFHVFSASDTKTLECLLDLTLYFYWDSILLDASKGLIVTTSNDEFVDVYAQNSTKLEEVRKVLSTGLKFQEAA